MTVKELIEELQKLPSTHVVKKQYWFTAMNGSTQSGYSEIDFLWEDEKSKSVVIQ